jgi:hypothetical protein
MPSFDNYVIIYHFNLLVEFFLFRAIMGCIAIRRSYDKTSAFWSGTMVDGTCRVRWPGDFLPLRSQSKEQSRVH